MISIQTLRAGLIELFVSMTEYPLSNDLVINKQNMFIHTPYQTHIRLRFMLPIYTCIIGPRLRKTKAQTSLRRCAEAQAYQRLCFSRYGI